MKLEDFKLLYARFNNNVDPEDIDTAEYIAYDDALHNNKECEEWWLVTQLAERNFEYKKHCCLQMSFHISQPNEMPAGQDDPNVILLYNDVFDEYGILIHDGGTSMIQIQYCPWCGSELPESKRDKWFEELGNTVDNLDLIPEAYRSDPWWRKLNNQ